MELSPSKVAAGAVAAAAAAAIGSRLGVAGTIAGAAVASVISASASALISHSLERGKSAALKALPLATYGPTYGYSTEAPTAQVPSLTHDDAAAVPALAETVRLPGRPADETTVLSATAARAARDAETVVLPRTATPQTSTSRKAKLRGWKPIAVVTALSFVVGTGAITTIELARGRSFPGVDGGVLSDDGGGGGGGKQQHPAPMTPGGGAGNGSGGQTEPAAPTPTPSGATSPSTNPATLPSTTPSIDVSTTPSTTPSTDPSSSPTSTPSSPAPPTGTAATAPATPTKAKSPNPTQPGATSPSS